MGNARDPLSRVDSSAVDAIGDRHGAQDNCADAVHQQNPDAPSPFMLRIRAAETTFDPDGSAIIANASSSAGFARLVATGCSTSQCLVQSPEQPFSIRTLDLTT